MEKKKQPIFKPKLISCLKGYSGAQFGKDLTSDDALGASASAVFDIGFYGGELESIYDSCGEMGEKRYG